MILAGMLVMLMQGGFALVTTGLCRAKSAGQVVTMNFMIYPLSVLGFWVCGFALMFWSVGPHEPAPGGAQWVLGHGKSIPFGFDPMTLGLFFYQAAVVSVAAAIPAGVMAERWKFSNFVALRLRAGGIAHRVVWRLGLGRRLAVAVGTEF